MYFSASARTHKSHGTSTGDFQVDTVKHLGIISNGLSSPFPHLSRLNVWSRRIRKVNVSKFDVALHRLLARLIAFVRHRINQRLLREERKEPINLHLAILHCPRFQTLEQQPLAPYSLPPSWDRREKAPNDIANIAWSEDYMKKRDRYSALGLTVKTLPPVVNSSYTRNPANLQQQQHPHFSFG